MSLSASRERGLVLPIDRVVLIVGVLLLTLVLVLTQRLAADVGDALTRNTVRLSLAWYAMGLCLMMRLAAGDWSARTTRGRFARDCWTWALVCFLVHLAMAFHFYHHWSHAHAFERTRQVSGVGEGVYISYLFTALWAADVACWWLRPALCGSLGLGRSRPARLHAVHRFQQHGRVRNRPHPLGRPADVRPAGRGMVHRPPATPGFRQGITICWGRNR